LDPRNREEREKKRPPLTREKILETGISLADSRGPSDLSMRKLANALGVEAMSLYNHIENKNDLIDGMVDIVFGEIEAPAIGGDWKAELRKRAISTRSALNRHRWAIGEMEGRTNHGPNSMRLHDAVLGCLRGAGFSPEMTVHLYSVQDAYIYGFVLQEIDMEQETPEEFAAEAERQMHDYAEQLGNYPHLVEVVGGYVAEHGYDYEKEFLYGLDLILDGLESRLNGN